MAVFLHDKYSKQIADLFKKESLTAGRFNQDYDFTGAKTVVISTPTTVAMNNYARIGTARYGTPTEMQDNVQELILGQDKSFSLVIDKGNNADQSGIKAAGKMLALQIKERAVPEMDKHVLAQLAQKAGKVVAGSTSLGSGTIAAAISTGTVALDDAEAPDTGRTLFINSTNYKSLRLSPEYLGRDKLGEKSVAKGQVGEYDGMAVVKVPSGRWPAYVNFIIAHKDAVTAPVKLDETKIHDNPPGISGNLLEGRQYYDCFVIGARANGVYVHVDTDSGKGTVLAAPTMVTTTGVISGAVGATIVHTLDGTDPRYSPSAIVGANAGTNVGTVVKAYQYKAGAYPSAVYTGTITAT